MHQNGLNLMMRHTRQNAAEPSFRRYRRRRALLALAWVGLALVMTQLLCFSGASYISDSWLLPTYLGALGGIPVLIGLTMSNEYRLHSLRTYAPAAKTTAQPDDFAHLNPDLAQGYAFALGDDGEIMPIDDADASAAGGNAT